MDPKAKPWGDDPVWVSTALNLAAIQGMMLTGAYGGIGTIYWAVPGRPWHVAIL